MSVVPTGSVPINTSSPINIQSKVSEKTCYMYNYQGSGLSENPGSVPNTPPTNTPPNIDIIRSIYLNYLANIEH